jgi:head-tail adaptor
LRTGELNRVISIQVITETIASGDVTQVLSAAVSVRARVRQIDGTRFMTQEELLHKNVYEIVTWDNDYSTNLKITFGSLTLYPIRVTVNPDRSSRDIITIIATTKV